MVFWECGPALLLLAPLRFIPKMWPFSILQVPLWALQWPLGPLLQSSLSLGSLSGFYSNCNYSHHPQTQPLMRNYGGSRGGCADWEKK